MKVLRVKGSLVSKSYVFMSIRNLFIDSIRCRPEEQFAPGEETGFCDESPGHVTQVDRKIDIEHLLGKLRTEEREALFLNCVEGFTAEEISRLTGQPRGTVLSHISRAKKRLQQFRVVHDQVESP